MHRLKCASTALAAALGLFFGTPAVGQPADAWQPQEEDSLLLDARLGSYQLGDGVRGYQTPQGICVNLSDIITALDIPIELDPQKGIAQGWAFEERNQLKIDRTAGKVRIGSRQIKLDPATIRDTPEGWCIAVADLSDWLGLGLAPDLSNSVMIIKSKTKLPVELAAERRNRAARVRPGEQQLNLSKLPQAKLPYRFWRTPSLDAVVTIGGLSDKQQGRRLDRRYEVYASGELAKMSFESRLSSDDKGRPADFRVKAYRSDVNAGLLGPLHATHFAVGDVSSFASPLTAQSMAGRGVVVSNRPIDRPETFDRKTFRGELPTGWDAELYRNSQLLAVAQNRTDGRYEFVDVPLLFGQNVIEIVLYGPQGQVRRSRQTIAVGAESIPPKQTWYWASVSEDQRDVISWQDDQLAKGRGWRASIGFERGIDQRTSLLAQVNTLVLEDERLTYVEGAVRRSIGSALVEIGGAYEKGGGVAGRAQIVAQIGKTNVSAESILARGFHSDRVQKGIVGSHSLALEHMFDLGSLLVPAHLEGRYVQHDDGRSSIEGEARLSTSIGRVSITGLVDWRQERINAGPDPPDIVDAALLANGSIEKARVRGEVRWRLSPESRFAGASLVAERPIGERSSARAELGYDAGARRVRGGLGYIRQFDKFAFSLTGEMASDGSVAAGLNLALSLGPDPRGGFRVTSQKLASNGSVLARVFRDENDDGMLSSGEKVEKDVQVMVARAPIDTVTDDRGEVMVDGLDPHLPVLISVDSSSLPDPLVQPAGLGVAVTPRPGLAMTVDLPLVGAGEILGNLVGRGDDPLEGVDLQLVNSNDLVIAVTRSDYDGFFLFESVPYGQYELGLTKLSASAIGLPPALDANVTINKRAPSVRLGRVVAGAPLPNRLAYQDVLMEGRWAGLLSGVR